MKEGAAVAVEDATAEKQSSKSRTSVTVAADDKVPGEKDEEKQGEDSAAKDEDEGEQATSEEGKAAEASLAKDGQIDDSPDKASLLSIVMCTVILCWLLAIIIMNSVSFPLFGVFPLSALLLCSFTADCENQY